MKKTIYILGAGFSKGLGAPLQSEIIKGIFDLDTNELALPEKDIFLRYKDELLDFFENTLYISHENFATMALEDIYTPIDRCIIDNISFRHLKKEQLLELRQKINALLIILFYQKLKHVPNNNYIQAFSKYLVETKKRHPKNDTFAIMSLNWDVILDDALHKEIDHDEGVLDYCCHTTPFRKGEDILPGLLARGKGLFNIKLLKMHGSMNWLQCQRCQRLFVTFDEKIAIREHLERPQCRLCNRNFLNEGKENAFLTSQLIMPTFLKDFNNVQLKLIWQNAGIELSEAKEIVFIGYSFPSADFELRQLLARYVRHNAKITVILKEPSITEGPEHRYKNFFGKRNINMIFDGAENYINNLVVQ